MELVRFILNIGMSYILFQRNNLVIHASSVSLLDNSYLFIGDSGYGKSSLAFEFFKKGYELISEDFTYIFNYKGLPCTYPSHPLIKLNKETKNEKLTKVYNSELDPLKRNIYKLNTNISKVGIKKITKIFFLDWGENKIEALSKSDIIKHLFKSTVRYMPPNKFPEVEKNLLSLYSLMFKNCDFYKYTRQKDNISNQLTDLASYL